MKKLMLALALLFSAQLSQAAESCMKNIKAVEDNEKSDALCKASYLKNLYKKYGNKTLNGPMGYQVKFLDMTNEMAVVANGKKYSGGICCVRGKWSMQNSLGSKTLSHSEEGLFISGYQFTLASSMADSGMSSRSKAPGARR